MSKFWLIFPYTTNKTNFNLLYNIGYLIYIIILKNYIQLLLERGVLLAISKIEGSEKRIIRVFNKSLKPARFDDNIWHRVILYRDLKSVISFY